MAKATNTTKMQHGISRTVLSSWDEFHKRILRNYGYETYVYRGQSCNYATENKNCEKVEKDGAVSFNLLPSLLRDLIQFNLSEEDYNECLEQHLKQFMESIQGRTNILQFLKKETDEAWALGQHYGLKTPLLDFSYSPYVAAFFALINSDCSKSNYCSVYAVSRDFIENTPEFEVYRPETDHNVRLLSQHGLFVKFNKLVSIESVIREKYDNDCKQIKLLEVMIPVKDKEKALQHLESMNITYRTLFPDLQGSSDHTNELFRKKIMKISAAT